MKTNVFIRILMAALLPYLFVIAVVIGAARNIITEDNALHSMIQVVVTVGLSGAALLTLCVFFSTRGVVRHIKRITESFKHVTDSGADCADDDIHIVTIPMAAGGEYRLCHAEQCVETGYSGSLRVLIVDDDEINLCVSSGLMRDVFGIWCDTAGSGREAISKVSEVDYDIIFMDHMMPELDGVDTTRRIRQLGGKYKKIPIIALTANAMIGTRKALIEGGMDDFMSKPIESERLSEILDTWVPESKRPWVSGGQGTGELEIAESEIKAVFNPSAERLLEEAGVNTRAGMENIGFDETMYMQSLRLLMDKLPRAIPLLDDLLERRNMREFDVYVHGLKGSLAIVGAAALSDDAKMLETAAMVDNAEVCRSLLRPFGEKLRMLHEAIKTALPNAVKSENDDAVSEEVVENGLKRLCAVLESYDYEAVTVELSAVMTMLRKPEQSEVISRAKIMIDHFDYDGAAALIRDNIAPDGGVQR